MKKVAAHDFYFLVLWILILYVYYDLFVFRLKPQINQIVKYFYSHISLLLTSKSSMVLNIEFYI